MGSFGWPEILIILLIVIILFGARRIPDGLEHRGIELVAIGQDRHAVAVMERCLTGRLNRVEKVIVVDRRPPAQVVVDPGGKEEHENEPHQEDRACD